MKVIQANCRVQFTGEDLDFIIATLGRNAGDRQALELLLADESARDTILDDDRLFHALLEQRRCLRVSSRFYFYVLVRHVFRQSGMEERMVADYVAELLADFSRLENARCNVQGQAQPLDYFFEMMSALQTADAYTSFVIRAHIGNYSLFLAGVFPDRIRMRAERRGAPDLRYYEMLGQTSFRMASDHQLARKYDLAPVFATLADRFHTTRRALNDMTDRLLNLGDVDMPLGTLLGPRN